MYGFGMPSLLQQLQVYLGDYVFLELIIELVGIPKHMLTNCRQSKLKKSSWDSNFVADNKNDE